jgi:LPS sulfotransferase NodH
MEAAAPGEDKKTRQPRGPEKVIRLVSQLHEQMATSVSPSSATATTFNPMNRPTRFLLMFVRGSGSTWVQALLNQQPHFFCGPETSLTPEFFDISTSASTSTSAVPANTFFGYKNKMDHLPSWAQQRMLAAAADGEGGSDKVTFVFMRRRDVVRHAVGLCRKNQLAPRQGFWTQHKAGKGNAWSEEHVVGAGAIDVDEFKREVGFVREEEAALSAFQAQLTAAGIPSLEVWYEDFLADHVEQLRRVYRWIVGTDEGFVVPVNNIEGAVPVKNTPLDLAQVVTNFDELKAWVTAHTDFTWYD